MKSEQCKPDVIHGRPMHSLGGTTICAGVWNCSLIQSGQEIQQHIWQLGECHMSTLPHYPKNNPWRTLEPTAYPLTCVVDHGM